jgi:sugar O-acyltransferase (sialic acid O-acetyltransferase NeuD family)
MNRSQLIVSKALPTIIWGASDQGRTVYPILKSLGIPVEVFVDDTENMESPIKHIALLKGMSNLVNYVKSKPGVIFGFVIAIGNPYGQTRIKLHNELISLGLIPISIADRSSFVCDTAQVGEGIQILPNAMIHSYAIIGNQCIINSKSLIEHDCELSDGVEIGPGAVLCGRVKVGKGSWIGANATVNPRIRIGSNSIVGSGSVVIKDVPENSIVVGNPARFLKENKKYG